MKTTAGPSESLMILNGLVTQFGHGQLGLDELWDEIDGHFPIDTSDDDDPVVDEFLGRSGTCTSPADLSVGI